MYFKYSGTVNSDLNLIKNFIDDVLANVKAVVDNGETIFDIRLILNELVINGALHGNKCMVNKAIKLSLELKDNQFMIVVEDEGRGINVDLNAKDSEGLNCCGRGLLLVNGISDELYIDNNKVIAIKKLN